MEKRKEVYSKQSTNSRRQRYLTAWPPKVCFWTILRETFTALTSMSTSGSLRETSACTTAKLSKLERQQSQAEILSPRLKFIVLRRPLFKRNCSSRKPQMWKHTWTSTTKGITYSRTSTQNSLLMSSICGTHTPFEQPPSTSWRKNLTLWQKQIEVLWLQYTKTLAAASSRLIASIGKRWPSCETSSCRWQKRSRSVVERCIAPC